VAMSTFSEGHAGISQAFAAREGPLAAQGLGGLRDAAAMQRGEGSGWDAHCASTKELIHEVRNGRIILLAGDEPDGSPSALILPAQMTTPVALAQMTAQGCGVVQLAVTARRAEELDLASFRAGTKADREGAATIGAKGYIARGPLAADQARTIVTAIDSIHGADKIVSPGSVTPLVARDGGVFARAGLAEAAVDLARLAGLNPSAVIVPVKDRDGQALSDDLMAFVRLHDIKIGTIEDLIVHRMQHDRYLTNIGACHYGSRFGGSWRAIAYHNPIDGREALALCKPARASVAPGLVRIHPQDIFTDALGVVQRGYSLEDAMRLIADANNGAVILIDRHGQAIGPAARDVERCFVAQILADLGIRGLVLLTDDRADASGFERYGLDVVGCRPSRA